MDRCALFVDAAYVLSDGAMAVHGTRHRDSVSWDYAGLLKLMAGLSRDRTGLPVLRCYWYETTPDSRRTAEHESLAELPGLKLRMGRARPGRRDGVETEIHRDLTTLARNGAISDAVIVSAEEDLVQVVAEAQDLGVRVILLHVTADGNWGIARLLRQESDDIIEISGDQLRPFVDLIAGAEPARSDVQHGYPAPVGQRALTAGSAAVPALAASAMPGAASPAAAASAATVLRPAAAAQHPLAASLPATPQPVAQHPAPQQQAQQPVAQQTMAQQSAAQQPMAAMPAASAQADPPRPDYPPHAADYRLPGHASRTGPMSGGDGSSNGSAAASSQSAGARPQADAGSGQAAGQQAPGQAGQRPADLAALNGFAAYSGDQLHAPGQPAGQNGQGSPGAASNGNGQPRPGESGSGEPGFGQPGFGQPGFGQRGFADSGLPDSGAGQNGQGAAQRGFPGASLPESRAVQNGHGTGPHRDMPGGLAGGGFGQHALPRQGQPGGLLQPGAGQQNRDQYGAGQHGFGQHDPGQQGPGQPGAREPGFGPRGSVPEGLPSGAGASGSPSQHAMGQLPQSQNGHSHNGYQPGDSTNGYQPNGISRGLPPAGLPPAASPHDGLQPGGYQIDGRTPYDAFRQNGTPPGAAGSRPGGHRQSDPLASGPLGSAQPYQGGATAGFGTGELDRGSFGPSAQSGSGSQAGGYRPGIDGQGPYGTPPAAGPRSSGQLPVPGQPGLAAPQFSLAEAVQAAHVEGLGFGEAVARDAPALWLEAVLARKPRMPSDLETRLLQGSALPIDSLLHDEVRHALRRGFWDALERR